MQETQKVFAYITQGDRLLVFTHADFPEAGIQVPAGTVEPGEDPVEAVMREAYEETGLDNLALDAFLGDYRRDMSDYGLNEIHHRYYYHLRCPDTAPAAWSHWEMTPHGQVEAEPIQFDFYWVRLPDEVPDLMAGHGQMIDRLLARLGIGEHRQ